MNTLLTLDELIESLGIVRRHLCAYGGWGRCDCKYGGVLETGKIGHSESNCGCCEVSEAIVALLGMTEEDFQEALRNGNKSPKLYRALFDRDPK